MPFICTLAFSSSPENPKVPWPVILFRWSTRTPSSQRSRDSKLSREISILVSLFSTIKSAVASNCVCESLLVPLESQVSINNTAKSPVKSIISPSSLASTEIDPFASILNLSSTIPFKVVLLIQASLIVPSI